MDREEAVDQGTGTRGGSGIGAYRSGAGATF